MKTPAPLQQCYRWLRRFAGLRRFAVLLPALACLHAVQPGGATAQSIAAPAEEVKTIVAAHAQWLTQLGEAKLLDAAGIDSGYITEDKLRDPRRARLTGRGLANLNFPGIVLRAGLLDRINLRGASLPGGNFSHASMEGADLSSANMEGSQLFRASLKASTLRGTMLAGANLDSADLSGADLKGANLSGASLREANLGNANLAGANLSGADLTGAEMTQANMEGADLEKARLGGAQLMGGNLSGADLKLADLSGAQLYGAVLDDAFLYDTNLSGVNIHGTSLRGVKLFSNKLAGTQLEGVNLAGVVYEPGEAHTGFIAANVDAIARAENLGLMTFHKDSRPLEDLRRLLERAGYQRKAMDITYALRRGLRQKVGKEGSFGEKLASVLQFVFFEFPIEYGAAPYRPLLVISVLLAAFGFFYMLPLTVPGEGFGRIWKISPRGRFFKSGGVPKEQVLMVRNPRGLPIAFWFSFLSAFNIGGRMFNLDDVFLHCQKEEYYLQATGWARVVSGLQALISVYLLVLMLLVFLEKVAF